MEWYGIDNTPQTVTTTMTSKHQQTLVDINRHQQTLLDTDYNDYNGYRDID